jgi:hypothetical protein
MSLRLSAGSNAGQSAPVDWNQLKKEILSRLDVIAEYRALGLRFVDEITTIKGWRNCHAVDRPDDRESAAVNVNNWIYHDRGGEGPNLNFFDFALKHGNWGTWVDVIRHYAAKAGVEIGEIKRGSRGSILEEVYHYEDANRTTRYGVHRLRQQNGSKDFRQYPLVNGEWLKEKGCMTGVAPLPYRLPDLLESAEDEPVILAEGEKDVDRCYDELEMVATTHHGGAKNVDATWPLFLDLMPARDYYVIPDNDEPGRKCMRRVCEVLNQHARSVRWLTLPGVPYKGDLSDWIDMGGTAEELGRLMHAAPVWTPAAADEIEKGAVDQVEADLELDATAADLIRVNTTIRWVWEGWIPIGVLTAISSEPGIGKTRFCADLLRRIVLALPWPDGSPNTLPPGSRAIWVPADNQHAELGTFPTTFGFDPDCLVLNATRRNPFLGTMLDSAEDLADFERRILRVKPVFVFIDTSLNATDRSSNKPEDAKAFFKPLAEIANRTQTAIVCVTHTNADGKPLGRRIQGQCRVVLSFSHPDPAQAHRRKLWVSKSNSLVPAPLGVTMGSEGNEYDFNPPEKPKEEHESPRGGKGKDEPPERLKACSDWLAELLEAAPDRVYTIRRKAEDAGFNGKLLYRAKDFLKLDEYTAMEKPCWRLPLNGSDF